MKRKIRILYVTAEITPFANAGGLGEVGRSFPNALMETGNYEIRRVMPLYKCVDAKMKYVTDFSVPMDQGYETCVVKKDNSNTELPTYFIQNDRFFCRDNIYAYEDDGFRFFFFCRAVVEMLKKLTFKPDIVHTNDWHTGFIALLLKKEFPEIRSVYTIHNVSYHGFIPASYLRGYLTEEEEKKLGYPQWLNFMRAGIIYSDLLTTVSPGYADEIRQPELSCGMSALIEERQSSIVGILNGIDTESYDPGNEGILEYPYDNSSISQKRKNKSWILEKFGLPDTDKPLLAMVTRLEASKGIDILLKAISYLDMSKFKLILLGTGNPYYQGMLAYIAAAYPGSIAVEFEYSSVLARKIYAAADIYLMPSQYEPCGLGQLYAMRYGAVPVVNPVGGLKDTVIDAPDSDKASGFYMEDWSPEALSGAINRAIGVYATTEWRRYIRNAMNYDSSWSRSVEEYRRYYEELLKDKR